jgi:hypothetical protein
LGGMLVSTLVTLVLVPLLLGLCFRLFPVALPSSNAHAKRAASPSPGTESAGTDRGGIL